MSQPEAIWFDLDGTLLDSAPSLLIALNTILKKHNLPDFELQDLKSLISSGAKGMVKGALGDAKQADVEDFFAVYQTVMTDKALLFPGIADILAELKKRKIPWGIVTNKSTRYTTPLLEHLEIAKDCCFLVCGDTLPQCKPSPEPILYACREYGVNPKNCLFVGDSSADILAGTAANMPTILVRWGYGVTAEIELVAGKIINQPEDFTGNIL